MRALPFEEAGEIVEASVELEVKAWTRTFAFEEAKAEVNAEVGMEA